jgi:hypothetical protein
MGSVPLDVVADALDGETGLEELDHIRLVAETWGLQFQIDERFNRNHGDFSRAGLHHHRFFQEGLARAGREQVDADPFDLDRLRPSRVGILDLGSGQEPRWIREATSLGALGMLYAALSPDAAAIAYNSLEGTGRYQVWLERVDGGGRRQVSTDGGIEPVWCRECGELFYRHRNRILASRIELAAEVVVGDPAEAFVAPDFVDTDDISFRVSSDGRHLYYVRRSKPPVRDRIDIIHNWFDELEAKAPRSP